MAFRLSDQMRVLSGSALTSIYFLKYNDSSLTFIRQIHGVLTVTAFYTLDNQIGDIE